MATRQRVTSDKPKCSAAGVNEMFIHISFPIADLRSFATRGGLTKPTWPNPQEAPQRPGAVEKGLQLAWGDFVRSVGVVRGRAKGGLPGFASEDVYADARGAIKFDTSALASSQGLNS